MLRYIKTMLQLKGFKAQPRAPRRKFIAPKDLKESHKKVWKKPQGTPLFDLSISLTHNGGVNQCSHKRREPVLFALSFPAVV